MTYRGSLDCAKGSIPQPHRDLLEMWAETGVPYDRSTCESSATSIRCLVEALGEAHGMLADVLRVLDEQTGGAA